MSLLELKSDFVGPMETAMLDSNIDSLTTLIEFYTHLFRRWTFVLFSTEDPPSSQQVETLTALASHTALLLLTTLTHDQTPTQLTVSKILDHLESHLPLVLPPLRVPLHQPEPLLISALLFSSPTLSTISRTTSLIAAWKRAFETPLSDEHGKSRSQPDISALNGNLIDACNLLLRFRAFNRDDTHARGSLVPSELVRSLHGYTSSLPSRTELAHAFSLSNHQALAALSHAAFAEAEEAAGKLVRHSGPVNQKSLVALKREGGLEIGWKDYRVLVLEYLQGIGAKGVVSLTAATMKGLMSRDGQREGNVPQIANT